MRLNGISALIGLLLVLMGCADRSFTPTVPAALDIGSNRTILAATSRAADANGAYGFQRAPGLSFLELTVSVPPDHTPGSLDFGYANPNPNSQFTMADRKLFTSESAFIDRLRAEMGTLPPGRREASVFVHGFNATQAETAFRAAQVATDIGVPGAMLIYSWPSKGKPLAYAYDGDSALFARDGLKKLLYTVKSAGVEKIVVVAHSMGSMVVMESLRQMDIKDPGSPGRLLDGVVLISPDLDVDLFRSQMTALSTVPKPFLLFVSGKDKALNLSSRLRGRSDAERLGNLSSIDRLQDLPIEIIDTTAVTNTAETSHFVPASSPTVLAMIKGARALDQSFGSDYVGFQGSIPGRTVRSGEASAVVLLPAEGPQR